MVTSRKRWQTWITGLLLTSLAISGIRLLAHPAVTPFLIYYGWIPQTRSHEDQWIRKVSGYRIIVLGGGDEWIASGDKVACAHVIKALPHTTFYGYVDIGVTDHQPDHTLTVIGRDLRAWKKLGVQGVLLDCAGASYGVSQSRLRTAVGLAHDQDLKVLLNSWNPQTALVAGLRRNDGWLAENWVIDQGRVVNPSSSQENLTMLPRLRAKHIAIWMTATDSAAPSPTWAQNWAWVTVSRIHGQYIAVAGPDYSSHSNKVLSCASWVYEFIPFGDILHMINQLF